MPESTCCLFIKSCILVALSLLTISAMAAETTRISVSSSGKQGNKSSHLDNSINANGRYLAFDSDATNLVAGDTNGRRDIFVHDRQTKHTSRISISSSGKQGNNESGSPSISADGRFVAFQSFASNLVAGDLNGAPDIFVHDRQSKRTTLVSIASSGRQGNGSSHYPSISADGRYVAFMSYANTLVPDGTKDIGSNVFVHDRHTKKTSIISIASNGEHGNAPSFSPSISADGRYVAFNSSAYNLVVGDTNGLVSDAFVHDRKTKKSALISIASSGEQGNGYSNSTKISANGRFVSFQSFASNLVVGDTNNVEDVFVHDRQTKQTVRISNASNGEQGNFRSFSYFNSISADGRFVAFESFASNLVSGDTNGAWDVFIHDRQTKQTSRVSTASNGKQGNKGSISTSINADGRFVAFNSAANNLVAGDTNNVDDTFVYDRKLDAAHFADLKITAVKKPSILKVNSTGAFQFLVTNLGRDAVDDVRLSHVLSNGSQVVWLKPTQGSCNRYTTISLCRLGKLLSGKSLNLYVFAKVSKDQLTQNLNVSGAPKDAVPKNNNITASTKVSP
jgi:Domain of unknown function DUF11/WD40-like Beta Propeller Repeat